MKRLEFDECWDRFMKDTADLPSQHFNELKSLYSCVEKLQPKNILEIGVQSGGTIIFWINVAQNNAKIIGIDNDIDTNNRMSSWKKWLNENQKLYIINKESQKSIEEVKTILQGEEVDFLFIDGYHIMPIPMIDYEMYSPLVRKEGIIAFHDIGMSRTNKDILSVGNYYWENLRNDVIKKGWKTEEFCYNYKDSYGQFGAGIGMIIKTK